MRRLPTFANRAFTLVEVTLALGVAAFGLVAIFGLLPVGINTNQGAIEQTAAAGILSAVAADLRATPTTLSAAASSTSQQFAVKIPINVTGAPTSTVSTAYVTSSGEVVSGLANNPHFLLTATVLPGIGRAPTLATLKISWPAAAGASRNIGSVEQLLVIDRN